MPKFCHVTICGATVTTTAAIGMKNAPMVMMSQIDYNVIDFCQPQPMSKMRLIFNIEGKSELDNDQMKEVVRNLFTGATYTVRDGDKVIASEPMPVEEILRNMDSFGPYMPLLLPLNEHSLTFSVQLPCGYPTIQSIYPLTEFANTGPSSVVTATSATKYPLALSFNKSNCDKYHVEFSQRADYEYRTNVTVKLIDKSTGRSLGESVSRSDRYQGATFEDVPAGDYYYEFWSDCPDAPHHRSADFTLPGGKPKPSVWVESARGCEKTGVISFSYDIGNGGRVT